MARGLGINKDLEPLAREVRRRGGQVEVTNSNHVRWTLPDGQVLTSGLTMKDSVAKERERKIRAALDPVAKVYDVQPAGQKFQVVNTETGEPIANATGYPRTFSTEGAAHAEARRLNRALS